MGIQSTGIGSGLDVNSLVTQLMAVERQPEKLLDNKTADYKSKLSAYGSMSGTLASLQTAADGLANLSRLRAVNATVGDTSLATASASASASTGSYSLEVQALAQAQKLKSAAFPSTTSSVGTGTLTFEFGTYSGGSFNPNADKPSVPVTIAAGQDTLAGVRDAINNASAGVSASIVNDGAGQRLVITAKDTGAASALRITVSDSDLQNTDASGLSRLAYDASTGGAANLTQVTAARDATLVIDGIGMTRASNTVSDAIDGVTLNLLKGVPGTTTILNVARSVDSAVTSVQSFVSAYNNATAALKTLSAYNADTKVGAVLQGDSTLLGVQSRVRQLLSSSVTNAGGYSTFSQIGVTFQKDGTLSTDSTKLRAALNDPAKDVAPLFAAIGTPSDSQVAYAAADSTVAAGSYAIQVTQIATRGTAGGSGAAALTITAGVNDSLNLTVDGTAATITLAAGTYTPTSLAAMVQSRINTSSVLAAAGAAVDATQSGGTLTLASKRWGAASSVAVTGGNASADLFGTPVSTAGVDTAGTIGGFAAIGTGQNLAAKGLSVTVSGGSTGARGSLTFTRGIANQLSTLIGNMLDGSIAARTSGLQQSIKDIASRRDAFEERMTKVESNMRAQFISLDTMLSSMQNTSTFLTQQLANLPKIGQ